MGVMAVLALQPTNTLAKQNILGDTITITATGNARPIRDHGGTTALAQLTLTGTIQTQKGNENKDEDHYDKSKDHGGTKIAGTDGTLIIGSDTYKVTRWHGEIDHNEIKIQGTVTVNGHHHELILHGKVSFKSYSYYYGASVGSVIFYSRESKLSSRYFLSLTGQATIS
jgi:hypothetical protein